MGGIALKRLAVAACAEVDGARAKGDERLIGLAGDRTLRRNLSQQRLGFDAGGVNGKSIVADDEVGGGTGGRS